MEAGPEVLVEEAGGLNGEGHEDVTEAREGAERMLLIMRSREKKYFGCEFTELMNGW